MNIITPPTSTFAADIHNYYDSHRAVPLEGKHMSFLAFADDSVLILVSPV